MDDDTSKDLQEEADNEQIGRFCDAFVSDFDGTSALIIRALDKDTESPTAILETLTEILRQAEAWLPAETCERFESELIPHITQVVLAKPDDATMDPESVECVADFLETVLERVAHRLLYCDACLLPTLMRILDEQRSFYENRLTDATDEKLQFVSEDGTRVSPLYLRIISHWGTIGGFTLLLRCLQASGARPESDRDDQQTPESPDASENLSGETVFSFEAIQYIYRSIYAIKDHLSADFLKQFIAPLAQSSRIYVASMNDSEFATLSREKLLEIVQIVELVVAQASGNDGDEDVDFVSAIAEAELCVQLLHLDLMLRFFTSSSLEKRIFGLVELIDILNKASPTHVEYFMKWISDNQLVDLLFGEKKHSELIKRALPVLRFVLRSDVAASDWIDAMWVCFGGKKLLATETDRDQGGAGSHTHQVVRVTVHGLLLEVIGIANLELLEHLLTLISESSRPLDADVLALVSSIAKGTSSLRARALAFIWKALPSSGTALADQGIEEIVGGLAESLDDMESDQETLVGVFIRLCVENIESATSHLSVSLRLLEKIGSVANERQIAVPRDLATRLLPATMAEMKAFEQKFRQFDHRIDNAASNTDHHVDGVRERLLALRACMVMAHLSLDDVNTFDVIDSVWDLCVDTTSKTDESASLFFQWIEYCFRTKVTSTTNASGRLLDERMAEELLHKRFSSIQGELMTMSALACFHHLFRKVNCVGGGIVVCDGEGIKVDEDDGPEEGESQSLSDLLTGGDIVGVEELWRFALHASDQAVAEEAMTLLARYHMDVVPTLVGSDFAHERKRAFVAKCIGHLCNTGSDHDIARAAHKDDEPGSISVVDRCLDCLRYFLDANQATVKATELGRSQDSDYGHRSGISVASDLDRLNKFALESLEQKLQLLDIYPSPMKESPYAAGSTNDAATPTMLYSGPRRPSWNFKQHHAILEAIEDEYESDIRPPNATTGDGSETIDGSAKDLGSMRRGELFLDVPTTERRLSIDTSVPGTLRPTQLTTSPAVRSRPNSQWFQCARVSSSQEPDFVLQNLETGSGDGDEEMTTMQSPVAVAQLLVNWPNLFDSLFDLVHSNDDATSRRAWGLLCQLPINGQVLKRMLKLRPGSNEPVAWFLLLDVESPHRLLYSLRLVEALLLSSRPAEPRIISEDQVRRQWRERFLRLGGAQHLGSVLAQLGYRDAKTPIVSSCIGAAARILAYLARLHYSPPDLIDPTSPFDSRMCDSTLPQALSLSGELIDLIFRVAALMLRPMTVPDGEDCDVTSLCIVELFCSLAPLSPSRALLALNSGTSNGVREMLEHIVSDFKSISARNKAVKSIVDMKDYFTSEVAARAVFEAVLKASLEMISVGEYSQELLELIISLSPRLQGIADWIVKESLVDAILAKVDTEARRNPKYSSLTLCSLLRVVAAIASQPGCLRDACLKFHPTEYQQSNIPWILDILVRGVLWKTSDIDENVSIDDPATRQAAQEVVVAIAFNPNGSSAQYRMPVLQHLSKFYETVHARLDVMGRPWSMRPTDELQDQDTAGIHFAGLVNPGCVCYMNSLMQQLFMMPAFRNGLLTVDASSTTGEWQNEVGELQKLFVSLASSQRKALDPTEFALSHRDMDGNPTDLNVQMDADEFFCLLLDRVETCVLKSSAFQAATSDRASTFLDGCFGGVLVNQILTEHGHLSEREEKFFALSLDISQKQHLPESLSLYVQGETLDGDNAYYCELANKKVSAVKRVCIKTLPQTLVCHLKRFEFDFDSMEKIKIHDYLAFPEEIDMFPYTSEAFSAARGGESSVTPMMYDLVGIVVHSGSSDMGHYYSFIKDRAPKDDASTSWYEFNDQTVKPFDLSTMGDECFGGEEVTQKWDHGSRSYVPVVQRKRRSAYMLVYERRDEGANSAQPKSSMAIDWKTTPETVQQLHKVVVKENEELRHVVNASTQEHVRFLQRVVDASLASDREASEDGVNGDGSLSADRYGGDDLYESIRLYKDADLHAAIITCQQVFGVSSLLSTDDELAIGTLLGAIEEWLKAESEPSDRRKVLFCRWLLSEATRTSAASQSDRAFIRRSWLFDIVVFCEKRLAFVQNCCALLQQSVQFLVRHSRTLLEQRAAVEFLRYVSEVYYERHDVVIEDPASGTRFPVPQASIIHATTMLGAFLKDCIDGDADDASKILFLTKSGYVDRFLFSLQDSESPRKSGASGTAPLTSRVRSCTFTLERQLLADGFMALPNIRGDLLEDPRLLLSHSVLKNMVTFEFTEVLTPLIVHTATHQMTRAQGEKLVSLLLAVLEEVKSTHLEQLLHVFGELLDAQDQADNASVLASMHDHIFSPSSGLLEAAAYYRDHRTLHEYAFLLVEFVVTRAASSPRLQRYFQNEEEVASQVGWVKHWLGNYLDPTGTIRRAGNGGDGGSDAAEGDKSKDEVEDPSLETEVRCVFRKAERAFGFAMLQTQTLVGNDELSQHDDKSFAVESLEDSDGLLFSSDGENQDDDDDNDASSAGGKAASTQRAIHFERRVSLEGKSNRVASKNERRRPEVEEETSSSATIITRAHMSSAA